MFMYYEEGKTQKISMQKAYRLFCTSVSIEQKRQGTTFITWLNEMRHMQILC